jgi:hypothetical protein
MIAANTHPTRLYDLAIQRMQLRQTQRNYPAGFTSEQQAKLDELTDGLLLAYSFAIGQMHNEIAHVRSLARRPR